MDVELLLWPHVFGILLVDVRARDFTTCVSSSTVIVLMFFFLVFNPLLRASTGLLLLQLLIW